MAMLKTTCWAILPLLLLGYSVPSFSDVECNSPQVRSIDNYLQVEPSGHDDTRNIQCALDLAVERSIPEVRLTRGEFSVDTLYVENFVGTFQGGGAGYTGLIIGGGVDCDLPGVITFARGEPRIRWMAIGFGYNHHCQEGPKALLAFTGLKQTAPSCSFNIMRAVIDRVVLGHPRSTAFDIPPWDLSYGVLVSAGDSAEGDCFAPLVGSFKLNRSIVGGFPYAVKIQMRGQSSITISNNSFDGNLKGLIIEDSNAIVSVSGNYFHGLLSIAGSGCYDGAQELIIANREMSHGVTRLDVYGNLFELATYDFCSTRGILLDQGSGMTPISATISDNQFRLDEAIGWAVAIGSSGVTGAVINRNTFWNFDDYYRLGVSTGSRSTLERNSQWTIVSNRGDPVRGNGFTISLGNASGVLVGPYQKAIFTDVGEGNFVLPQ